MTREEAIKEYVIPALRHTWNEKINKKVLEALEQEPFINKPCVSDGVCEHDKNKVLDKIRAEIMQVAKQEKFHDAKWALGLRYAVNIIDKYKADFESQESEDNNVQTM